MSRGRNFPESVVDGAASWRVANAQVEAFITRQGGQLAPVTFHTPAGAVQPFAVAPWAGEELPATTPGVLRPLRGDFFCLPFGGNGTAWRGERHPPHGETASGVWRAVQLETSAGRTEFVAEMKTRARPGRVLKRIQLREGETNVYCRHELSEFSGPMPLGHHALLRLPETGEASLALSPWTLGRVCPRPFEDPAQGGYSALAPSARFASLQRVPLATRGQADLTRFPAREGFDDLVMVSSRPGRALAWATLTVPGGPGYVWFAVKDPRLLASTLLWHSNGGRHYPPWSGRHRRVLGIEDVTSYFHYGLNESANPNPLSAAGVPTTLRLRRNDRTSIPYVMGVVPIPRRFDRVRRVRLGRDRITLTSASGVTLDHAVDLTFLEPT